MNATDDDAIRRLLMAVDRPSAVADSLVHALAQWRNEDDSPRPLRAWYAVNGIRAPLNGTIAEGARCCWSAA